MRIYSVFYCDKKIDGNMVSLHQSTTEENAQVKLEKYALEHIKDEEGAKHTKIAFQDSRSVTNIRDDAELRNGLYLKNEGKMIYVYEKKTQVIPGTFYNGEETVVVPVGYFCVISQNVDVPEPIRCSCQLTRTELRPTRNQTTNEFISQLTQMFVTIENEGDCNVVPKNLDYNRATFKKPTEDELKPVEKKYLKN